MSYSATDVIPVSEGTLRKILYEMVETKTKDPNDNTLTVQQTDAQKESTPSGLNKKQQQQNKKFSIVGEIKSSVKYDFFKIITASLLFITALSWNDTFREFFQSIDSLKKAKLWVYSLVITAITLLVTRLYAYFLEKDELKKINADLNPKTPQQRIPSEPKPVRPQCSAIGCTVDVAAGC